MEPVVVDPPGEDGKRFVERSTEVGQLVEGGSVDATARWRTTRPSRSARRSVSVTWTPPSRSVAFRLAATAI
jgi:hypothetical protein